MQALALSALTTANQNPLCSVWQQLRLDSYAALLAHPVLEVVTAAAQLLATSRRPMDPALQVWAGSTAGSCVCAAGNPGKARSQPRYELVLRVLSGAALCCDDKVSCRPTQDCADLIQLAAQNGVESA